ncbi:MAG: glycosyltransferase family 4 protein [Desulfuromonadales bacterium]|nr:glycosyltransferase family 4 protein [Desulfuromonadales bacterium]
MNKRKKILILIDSSRLSGPGRQVLQIFQHIDRERYDLTLGVPVVGHADTELLCEARKSGVQLLEFRQRHSFDPFVIFALRRKVKALGIDIVQTHGYKPCVLGAMLKLLSGHRWLHFMHGHTAEDFKVALYFRLEFTLARFANRIATVSDEMRARLVARGLPDTKTATIHNALDPAQFQSNAESASRNDFAISEQETLIGVIGRLSPEKGPDVFLDAFKRFLQQGYKAKVLLIGEGPLEQELRQQCAALGLGDQVVFAGYQPAISQFYPLLDLLALPSRSEGLPNVALEALYFGVPVVATEVGGTPEVIVGNETGLLTPADAPDALAETMGRICDNADLRKRLVENGRSLCREQFSPSARVNKIETLYASLLSV